MRQAVVEEEIPGIPVGELVCLPAEAIVEHEVVVRPLKAVTQRCREAINLQHPVVAEIQIRGVRLAGIVGRKAQGSWFLSEEPGLHETGRQCGVVGAVGLEAERKVLGISQRNRPPCPLVEHAASGEVVERYAGGGHEGAASPTSGKLQLAGRLLRDVVYQIHRIVVLVRNHGISGRTHDGFRIELAEGCDFTDGALEVTLAEQVPRTGEHLTADYLLAGQVVTVDDDIVQSGLLALGDAHFHIDGVVLDIGFHRGDGEEKVAVVPI